MYITSRISIGALALVAATAITGCSGSGMSSLPHTSNAGHTASASRTASDAVAGAALFHANSEKYSDAGSHPVTGRSGSAVVQSRALLAKDGTTLVEATTGTIDGAQGPGNFRHVTTTATTLDGVEQPTAAYNNLKAGGYWSHTYTGLAHNESLKVDTNVTDLDPRTDVVTTVDTVKKRPDLAAIAVSGPAKAHRNKQVTFSATVRELNGDVGAHANCTLSVDGQQVDQAEGIWVDAAGSVSCTFQTSFATLGTKHISVAVTNVVPGDWDTANNTAQTTIEIIDPLVKLSTYAWAGTYSWKNAGTNTYSGPNQTSTTTYNYQNSESNGYIEGYTYDHGFQFPVQQMSAKITADSNPVLDLQLGSFSMAYSYYYGESCAYQYAPGSWAGVCSNGNWTQAWYNFYHTSATYFSKTVSTTCSYLGCTTNSYINNYHAGDGNTFQLGNIDQFTLKLTDAAGTNYIGQTAPAQAQGYSYNYPYSGCWNYYYYYSTNQQWCENGNYSQSNRYVYAFGSGT